MFRIKSFLCVVFVWVLFIQEVTAQNFGPGAMRGGFNGTKSNDSLTKRDQFADSITIYFKKYNDNQFYKLDSSYNDFFVHFPLPYTSYHLGNLGTASNSYLFSPKQYAGFDAGFHAFDGYSYTLEQTPLYQTTRPYTEFGYLLGGKGEQLIEVKHTQNKTKQFNFSFEYRFSNSPGNVKNQNANLNNMRVTGHFQSKRKRYESFLIMLFNKAASSENGGLVNARLLDSLSLNNPYELETRLGVSGTAFRNPFNTNIATGNVYKDNQYIWKQSYDFGQKDSIVKDTVTTHLFYPRLRLQNEMSLRNYDFLFNDATPSVANYANYFGVTYDPTTKVKLNDSWTIFTDEFSLISFPEKKNSNQFLQLSGGYTQMNAQFLVGKTWTNYDLYGKVVYKNKTRNQLWDLLASGKLYLNGYHAGDFEAKTLLSRVVNKAGTIALISFQNINRTPSANLLGITQFPISSFTNIKKENTTSFIASLSNADRGWKTAFTYQLINNYHYFKNGFTPAVATNVFSYIKADIEHKIKLTAHWNWYDEIIVQALEANAPVHVPAIITRQRLAFEGNFYKNLNLSTGLEFIYHTNYKADAYMPFTGQFYLQDAFTTQNRPTTNAYLHFLIKRFKGYVRLENLNTLLPTSKALGNTYNFTAQNYPGTGTWFRVGIWWNFIN